MACGDMGRFANAKNILSQHARFLLKEEEAAKIVNDMVNQVRATWYTLKEHVLPNYDDIPQSMAT